MQRLRASRQSPAMPQQEYVHAFDDCNRTNGATAGDAEGKRARNTVQKLSASINQGRRTITHIRCRPPLLQSRWTSPVPVGVTLSAHCSASCTNLSASPGACLLVQGTCSATLRGRRWKSSAGARNRLVKATGSYRENLQREVELC
jgi:hypothetical protein